jgi:hypothetical protein
MQMKPDVWLSGWPDRVRGLGVRHAEQKNAGAAKMCDTATAHAKRKTGQHISKSAWDNKKKALQKHNHHHQRVSGTIKKFCKKCQTNKWIVAQPPKKKIKPF